VRPDADAVTVETDKPHLVPVARMEIFEPDVVILADGVAGHLVCASPQYGVA